MWANRTSGQKRTLKAPDKYHYRKLPMTRFRQPPQRSAIRKLLVEWMPGATFRIARFPVPESVLD